MGVEADMFYPEFTAQEKKYLSPGAGYLRIDPDTPEEIRASIEEKAKIYKLRTDPSQVPVVILGQTGNERYSEAENEP